VKIKIKYDDDYIDVDVDKGKLKDVVDDWVSDISGDG